MKCDGCGCQFPADELRHDTRNEFGPRSRLPYRIVPLTLCPECGTRRRNTIWWFVAFFSVPAILALMLWLLRNLDL
jgi:hypothetical protein